jgi:hypothetical protein
MEFNNPDGQVFVPCAVCGRRPGTVQVVYAANGAPASGAVCEVCARRLMAAQAQGQPGVPALQEPISRLSRPLRRLTRSDAT